MMALAARLGRHPGYWAGLFGLGLCMEAVALYYQYRLDYWPCVLCIHVRIWVMALILTAAIGFFSRRRQWPLLLAHAATVVIGLGLLERSWKLLGVERGTLEGSCSMDSGLPPWFALDQWFPWLFKVWEPCGYTPELLFGITMAEALVGFSMLLTLLAVFMSLATLIRKES